MKRVKGVEDLNICIIGAQGIVGVGAPPAFAYCRRRRRPFSRWNALDLLSIELFLPTGKGAESAVPALVPAGPPTSL